MAVEVDILLLNLCGEQFCEHGDRYFAPIGTWRSVLCAWREMEANHYGADSHINDNFVFSRQKF